MNARTKQIAMRYARKLCIKRLCRKVRKYGSVVTSVTITDDPAWYKLDNVEATAREDSERAAVNEALREEQIKRGLR